MFKTVIYCFLSLGCQHHKQNLISSSGQASVNDSELDEDQAANSGQNLSKSLRDLEAKQAKMWARIDELEEDNYQNRQKLQILEKSLMLGLTPEDLKAEESPKANKRKAQEASMAQEGILPKKGRGIKGSSPDEKEQSQDLKETLLEKNEGTTSLAPRSPDESANAGKMGDQLPKEFQEALAKAQESYQGGNYSRAIVELTAIKERFGNSMGGGVHLLWIGRSWAKMKEFQLAADHLNNFVIEHPESPWLGRAKFELARVELQLGMRTKAISHFKEIIQNHPYEDISEMARMQLNSLEKSF